MLGKSLAGAVSIVLIVQRMKMIGRWCMRDIVRSKSSLKLGWLKFGRHKREYRMDVW